MEKRQLESLKKEFNQALDRYYKMCKWCDDATIEEQRKYESHIFEVINKCNDTLNELRKYIIVTQEEILGGFKR